MHLEIQNMEQIGTLIKQLRKRYKVTQEELAKIIGISAYSIVRYEKRNYAQASSQIVFSILGFFQKEYVKEAINLSLISK